MEKRFLSSKKAIAFWEGLGATISGFFSKPKIETVSPSAQQKEVELLCHKVQEVYKGSVFAQIEPYELASTIVNQSFQKAERGSKEPLVELFFETVLELATTEGFWGLSDIDWSIDYPLSEQIEIKEVMLGLHKKFSDDVNSLDIWKKTLVEIFSIILSAVPEIEDGDSPKASFGINLVHLLNYPQECVEKVMLAVFENSLIEKGLFSRLRKIYEENADLVSGIDPLNRSTAKVIYPTDSKLIGRELISGYLKRTAFDSVFSSPYPFFIPPSLRFEHCHILAGTGYGKTQLLQKLMLDDIREGRGFCAIDSQGDLIRKLSMLAIFDPDIRDSLADKLIIIDPTDIDYPVCLNMFSLSTEGVDRLSAYQKELIVNGTVDMYSYMFGALFGAELTQRQGVIFTYIARLMMEIPNATIQTLRELMEDGKKFLPNMDKLEGSTRAFFKTQFFSTSFNQTKKQVLTRLWGVLSNATLERMFSNTKNKVDLSRAINEDKIILINTAKNLLQKDGSAILGRFFIALLGQAVLKRTAIPEKNRRPFFVYIDEAHEYFDERLEDLLNQARKYKVGFTLAHQNLDQLGSLKATVHSSTSIKLVGGVSSNDAISMAKEMRCKTENIESVRKSKKGAEFAGYLKNVTTGVLPLTVPFGVLEKEPVISQLAYTKLIELNRTKYCQPLEEVLLGIDEQPFRVVEKKKKSNNIPEKIQTETRISPKPEKQKRDIEEKKPREVKVVKPPKSTQVGKGGIQHRYLQNLVKKISNERGFKATVEKQVLSGAGSVDVAIEGHGKVLAVEISVSTDWKWEASNISKCLATGADQVIILSSDKKHLQNLKTNLSEEFSDHTNLSFFTAKDLISCLDKIRADSASEEKTVRGYKVKVKYAAISKDDGQAKKDAIAKVLVGKI